MLSLQNFDKDNLISIITMLMLLVRHGGGKLGRGQANLVISSIIYTVKALQKAESICCIVQNDIEHSKKRHIPMKARSPRSVPISPTTR